MLQRAFDNTEDNVMIKKYYVAIAVCSLLAAIQAPGLARADSLKDKLDNLQISGFVDGSVSGSNVNSKTTPGALNNWGTGLDQVELDVMYHKDNVGLRFDLNMFPSSQPTPGASPTVYTTTTDNSLLEQGYMTYTVPSLLDKGLTFTFGKFNAPIGWELLDPNQMYQYSHAMTFLYAIPTNLIGGMVSGAYGMVDASLYYTNHADTNGVQVNGMKTFGGRIGITPMDGVNLGISYIHDATANNPTGLVAAPGAQTIDIDATYTGIKGLILGGEYNEGRGWQGVTAGVPIKSRSWFVTANYALTDIFGVTARYENANFDRSTAGSTTALTGAVTAALGEGFGALVELREDRNTKVAADINGTPGSSIVTSWAMEMTYSF
jgi:Putative beta-barrel porin-2, OmpL-like. bbp2